MFSYHEVMLLFLGVMISEVILLDTFNTFGLPTSTTVSLVFGILGSAVATAPVQDFQASHDAVRVGLHQYGQGV